MRRSQENPGKERKKDGGGERRKKGRKAESCSSGCGMVCLGGCGEIKFVSLPKLLHPSDFHFFWWQRI